MALGGDPPSPPRATPASWRTPSSWWTWRARSGTSPSASPPTPPGTRGRPTSTRTGDHLADKLARADFAVTQFFFDVDEWVDLVADLGRRGVTSRCCPGSCPSPPSSGIARMAQMGAPVPAALVERLEAADRRGGAAAVRAEGVAAAIDLCRALLAAGAPGLHFYTLNRSTATREIHRALFSA